MENFDSNFPTWRPSKNFRIFSEIIPWFILWVTEWLLCQIIKISTVMQADLIALSHAWMKKKHISLTNTIFTFSFFFLLVDRSLSWQVYIFPHGSGLCNVRVTCTLRCIWIDKWWNSIKIYKLNYSIQFEFEDDKSCLFRCFIENKLAIQRQSLWW